MEAYSSKYDYMIVWSAKSGCTLLRQLFLYLHKEELEMYPPDHWHSLNKYFPKNININKNDIKKIVLGRNPYYRVVSMFCNKYCGGGGHCILSRYFELEKCTFREFVKKLKSLKDNGELNNIVEHISNQTTYNDENTYKLKVENFNESIIEIYNRMNLQNLIPKIEEFLSNKDVFINNTTRNSECEYIYDKEYTINSTIFPDYKYFYDDELLDLVFDIYKSDFINFNYERDTPFE